MNEQQQQRPATSLQALRQQAPTEMISVGLTNSQSFELAQRAAKLLAASTLVPKDYQGNLANCVIALNMAARVGADPLMVMQNLVIVHGRPTWSSQFLIATVNACGRFSALRYEFFGTPGADDWGCRAWAVEKATGEKLIGTDVTLLMAKREGWYSKNGSKWQSMPQQMLMYRAGSWWCRAYAPELSLGLHTADEIADAFDADRGADGAYSVDLSALRDAHAPVAAITEPAQQAPEPQTEPQQEARQSAPAEQDKAPSLAMPAMSAEAASFFDEQPQQLQPQQPARRGRNVE